MPKTNSTSSVGSGVIIDRQGHILTNHHVIKGANLIEVLFAAGLLALGALAHLHMLGEALLLQGDTVRHRREAGTERGRIAPEGGPLSSLYKLQGR